MSRIESPQLSQPRPASAARQSAALMGGVAVSLAVMSALHLGGVIHGGVRPYRPSSAGIAEAVIGVVLAAGAVALRRAPDRARLAAIAATGFAIVGFLLGLTFTVSGGVAIDVVYHCAGLPVLALTLFLQLRRDQGRPTPPGASHPVGT